MRMLLPRTTTLYRILRSLPVISKAFSSARFMKTSTPITIPSISRPPFNLILSFLATYLVRSGEQPCFGSARFTALVLPAIYNRLQLQRQRRHNPFKHLLSPHCFINFNNRMNKERDLFQSILCKFIINLPQEELRDLSRLSYHAEKAYYYYIDKVYCDKQPKNEGEFFFKLAQYASDIVKFDSHQIAVKLQENKPVCGAIIFNRENTKVLVIKVRGKFGFPKGKWNQHETAEACAAREVQQETGVYIHHRIDPKIRIEFESHGSNSYFFVARGVGEEERLKIDKKQVDGVCWMWIEDVRLNLSRFVQKSKIAWSHYEKELTKKGMDIDQFIEEFGKKEKEEKEEQGEKAQEQDFPNPFLCFKLDRVRLKLCLSQGQQ